MAPNIEKSNLNIIVPGFGCCRGEILATREPLYDIQRFGINFVNIAEDADILLITGFTSETGVERAREIYLAMNKPKWVFAVGSCAIGKGRFCAGTEHLERFKREVKIDMFVPGCPPRPEAFIYAVLRFMSEN